MSYSVIVVEDEPAAAENLCDIIRLYCPRFQVVGLGENGQEGLELAWKHHPDLLLTDIRMPRMDGLELISRVREELPDTRCIIVSGYQDFEYARTALQHGAVDYLLKPVSPSNLRTTLERTLPGLGESLHMMRINIIRRMAKGELPEQWELEKHFPAPRYLAALVRKNGLPSRFSPGASTEIFSWGGEVVDLYGRDELESLYICPREALSGEQLVQLAQKPYRDMTGYTTTVLRDKDFSIGELPGVVKSLYQALDNCCAIGVTQVLSLDQAAKATGGAPYDPDGQTRLQIEHFCRERQQEPVRRLLFQLLEQCEDQSRPQLWVEGAVRLFLGQVQHAATGGVLDAGMEYMVDDAFYYATCYEDLRDSLADILAKLLPEEAAGIVKVDTPEFFSTIQQHLEAHLAEAMSLQTICKAFGISQTYLSRLFRKYAGQSFNSYLTHRRMERAKDLLTASDMLIKDVAAMVGYGDQFYFSRLFRSYTGKAPSEFAGGDGDPS